jgi:ABC-2 type transport system ATP-binding protein
MFDGGELRLVLLHLIAEAPRHGYELIKAIEERTGGTYCEFVPRNMAEIHAMADALGPLLPAAARDAITADSDRITIPAPDGPGTLSAALWRLNSAHIELADIILRKPSLDDVFLALTADPSAASDTEVIARGASS